MWKLVLMALVIVNFNSVPVAGGTSSSVRVYYLSDFGGDIHAMINTAAADLEENKKSNKKSKMLSGTSTGHASLRILDLKNKAVAISKSIKIPCNTRDLTIRNGEIKTAKNFKSKNMVNMHCRSTRKPAAGAKTESIAGDAFSTSVASSSGFSYQSITFENIRFNANHKAGIISISKALRTTVDNCRFTGFTTHGINAWSSSETNIRNSLLGQYINSGRHPLERNFTGTAINLSAGTSSVVSGVTITSAATGIALSGQGNTLSGVHCYNKATRLGGTGIYVKKTGSSQNRILDSYLDYTGIVAEDPLQLDISNNIFRGDAFVDLRSVKGMASKVSIGGNMFSGSKKGNGIVQLEQTNGVFSQIDQVVVDKNNAEGMSIKSTVAQGVVHGNGTIFTLDFNAVLLFPNRIRHVQYSLITSNVVFPNHAIRSTSNNRVVIATDVPVSATVFATVDQN